MNRIAIKFATRLMTVTLVSLVTVTAQTPLKSWDQWSEKEAQKILNNSPWCQTQTETDTSEMFFIPSRGSRVNAPKQAISIDFRIRFFTAKPVRQAFLRLMILNNKTDDQKKEQLTANLDSDNQIVVAVTFDSQDSAYSGSLLQAFHIATTALLKNVTYLERKDGKRLFLSEYVRPGKDGFGARFIFPRLMDGKPFLVADSGQVRFYSRFSAISSSFQLDRRFKVADMIYDGKLEF